MMYRFKSKADSDLFMNQGPAERILAIIGKEPGAQGIIQVHEMAAAIAALQSAVDQEQVELDRVRERARQEGDAASGAEAPAGARAITLHQRAWPFIQLLSRSLEADTPVVWGV